MHAAAVEPSFGWYFPAAHCMHEAPSPPKYCPAAHTTSRETVGLGVSLAQSEEPSAHSEQAVMPPTGAYVPSAQSVHLAEPVVLAIVPMPQS